MRRRKNLNQLVNFARVYIFSVGVGSDKEKVNRFTYR